jgi:hypothetical protein
MDRQPNMPDAPGPVKNAGRPRRAWAGTAVTAYSVV